MDFVNAHLGGLLIAAGFIVAVISLYHYRNAKYPCWAFSLSVVLSASGIGVALFKDATLSTNVAVAEWQSFAQSHNCKIVERNVPGGVFEPNMSAWLCDDGVKYYKPEGYEKDVHK